MRQLKQFKYRRYFLKIKSKQAGAVLCAGVNLQAKAKLYLVR